MHPQSAVLATFAVAILTAVAKPLAPSMTGYLSTDVNGLGTYIIPFTATQCEPFTIYYDLAREESFDFASTTLPAFRLAFINFPKGTGYVKWICNVPAGIVIHAVQNYVVQAGSPNCLGDLNTTYSHLTYSTSAFASYTRNPPPYTTTFAAITLPTTSFPTGTFETITLNPNLAVVSTTSSSSSSLPSSSSTFSSTTSASSSLPPPSPMTPSPTPSPKPNSASIAAGLVGAVAFILLIVLILFWRRRKSSVARAPSPIDPQPTAISGLETSQLGHMDPSSLSGRFSGAEFLGGTPQYPFDPYSHGTEPTSDNLTVVPVTVNPAALVGQRPSQDTITPFYAGPAFPSQRPRKTRNNGRQASHPRPSPEWPLRIPEQQQPYTQSFNTPADAAPETSRPDAVPLSQQPSKSETQKGPLGFTTVPEVISPARLSETEGLAAVRNLLVSDSSGRPDLARQNKVFSPPPYTE